MQPRLTQTDRAEILRYLGCRSTQGQDELLAWVAEGQAAVAAAAAPRACWRVFPLDGMAPVGSGLMLAGEDIRRHLDGCDRAVLLAVTLGRAVDELLLRAEVRDMARALVWDSCASAAVENVCDNFETDLRAHFRAQGVCLTGRFSPGYGDLPLSLQPAFCAALDAERRIGLTVSRSGLLLPRKSVTAVLGLAATPKTGYRAGCAHCLLYDTCQRRKEGNPCGAEPAT